MLPKEARTPDRPATQFIAAIGKLYAAEARARDAGAPYRRRLRARYSARVLKHIESLLLTYQPIVTPNSKLGRALAYLRGQWPKLARYVGNGHWPIDNNPCENAIRPFVVGRKGGSSRTSSAVPPPAPIFIPSSSLARPITSIRTPIWSNCCAHCRWQRRQMTTKRCFPGKSPSQLPASNRVNHM